MDVIAAVIIAAVAVAALAGATVVARRKTVDRIVMGAIRRRREPCEGTRHIFFCFADHFEPLWQGGSREEGIARVQEWHKRYPALVDPLRDRSGRVPHHAFFYPEEEYIPECIDLLADLQRRGYGDVEVHLHHDNDTSEGFREKLEGFKRTLRDRHGLLHSDPETGEPVYAFIHGNWALDNTGLHGRWCGVNDELIILRETGCYADFTYPSAPHRSQPPVTNSIYYATDDPLRPASHHRGVDATFGTRGSGDLLLINGPLALNWRRRKRGFLPAIENADVASHTPVTPDRVDLWVKTAVAVRGWPSWIFIKVHTHGTQPDNAAYLLGDEGGFLYRDLLSRYDDGDRHVLHFVSPWEMVRAVHTLEAGDPERIRRFEDFDYSL